jgi:alkanesulfonate monooxygenase SsuD/methylene tetrahydromethanopterin reductase-like flavin-dependent oxidoreductase (luciferase family)
VAPAADAFATGLAQVRSIAAAAGRVPASVTGAMYVTIALDDDAAKANDRLMRFLGAYYAPQPAEVIRKRQACYAGPVQGVAAYLEAYAQAGVTHFCVRFAGDHETQMTALAKVRATLGW